MQNPYIDENDEQRMPVDAPGDAPFIEHPSPATASYPYYQFGPGPQQPAQPPAQQPFIPTPGQLPPVTNSPASVVASPGGRGLRTGAIIALTIVLALVFGTGLFA